MKDDSPINHSPLPGDERFVNAALEEHARLGSSRNDDALIERILLETVNKESNTIAIAAHGKTPWKSLVIGVTSAAASLTLGVFFFQSLQLKEVKRSEQEVHFVVRILNNTSADDVTSVAQEAPTIAAQSSTPVIEPTFAQVDAVVRPIEAGGNYLLETSFGKSLNQLPAKAHRHNSFLISAEEVVSTDSETRFGGHVVIAHDTWKIEANSASVPNAGNAGGNTDEPTPSLRASGVVVTQKNPQRTVYAKELVFDAVSGNIVLTGVETLSAVEGNMTNFKPSDELTLTENSYSIQSTPTIKYASPELVKPGKE